MPAVLRIAKGFFDIPSIQFIRQVNEGVFRRENLEWIIERKTSGALGRTAAGLKTQKHKGGKAYDSPVSALKAINSDPSLFDNPKGFYRLNVKHVASDLEYFFEDVTPQNVLFFLKEFQITPSSKLVNVLQKRNIPLTPKKPFGGELINFKKEGDKRRQNATQIEARRLRRTKL